MVRQRFGMSSRCHRHGAVCFLRRGSGSTDPGKNLQKNPPPQKITNTSPHTLAHSRTLSHTLAHSRTLLHQPNTQRPIKTTNTPTQTCLLSHPQKQVLHTSSDTYAHTPTACKHAETTTHTPQTHRLTDSHTHTHTHTHKLMDCELSQNRNYMSKNTKFTSAQTNRCMHTYRGKSAIETARSTHQTLIEK